MSNRQIIREWINGVFPENWEIIPVGKKEESLKKARTVLGPPKTEEEKTIEELKRMASQYMVGSLERKVIDEEIRKIQK